MEAGGKIRSVGVKTKLDDNDKEITILDVRVEIFEGRDSVLEMLSLPGKLAKVVIKEANMKIGR